MRPFSPALLAFALLLALPTAARSTKPTPPHAVVYTAASGKTKDLVYLPLAGGRSVRLARGLEAPTAVQCTADGRFVVYAAGGKVWAKSVSKPDAAPLLVRDLPKAVWQHHAPSLRAFVQLSPSGRYLTVPDPEGVLIYDLVEEKPLVIKPPGPGDGSEAKVRMVHPPRWQPGQDVFLYLTQSGEHGAGDVVGRLFDLVQGRHTLWFPVLKDPVDAVEGFDAWWNAEGSRVALSLQVKRQQRSSTVHRIFSLNPYQALQLPGRLEVGRLHGFDPRLGDVLFTAKLGGAPAKLWSYSFTRSRKTLLDIGYLGPFRMVSGFYPERRTALVAQLVPGQCGGRPRLFKASIAYPMKALVKWAAWSEVVAEDPQRSWLVFRSGSTCTHQRPVLYLMQSDGWGLTRDLPGQFAPLRSVAPQEAALCPAVRRAR
jgi:hypothetical protein